MSPPEVKKKTANSDKRTSIGAILVLTPGEGSSANPGDILGPNTSMLENPTVAKKLLEGVIPPFDQEEVSKLDLDRAISRLFN